MSQIVTTTLVILLVIVSIGVVWAIVSAFVEKGAGSISLDKFTLNLKIKSAKINYTSGIASVRVVRNPGAGELTSIKFVVEDARNSEIFDEPALDFYELAERTYDLDLASREFLDIATVHKISIAPVYVSGVGDGGSGIGDGSSGIGGGDSLGVITDSVKGDELIGMGDLNESEGDDGPDIPSPTCDEAIDCGTDEWIDGTRVCSETGNNVMQYMRIYSCVLGFCDMNTDSVLRESCIDGTTCFNGACLEDAIPCTEANVEVDCGVDGWVGMVGCSADESAVTQDWQSFQCLSSECVSTVGNQHKVECLGEEICFDGECFIPLECAQNSDCNLGEICVEGVCELEEFMYSGNVRSAWPWGVGEYFDSFDLPDNETGQNLVATRIIFPNNSLVGCLEVIDFEEPAIEGGPSYIRLKPVPTNISDDDYFEIWETDYACTLI